MKFIQLATVASALVSYACAAPVSSHHSNHTIGSTTMSKSIVASHASTSVSVKSSSKPSMHTMAKVSLTSAPKSSAVKSSAKHTVKTKHTGKTSSTGSASGHKGTSATKSASSSSTKPTSHVAVNQLRASATSSGTATITITHATATPSSFKLMAVNTTNAAEGQLLSSWGSETAILGFSLVDNGPIERLYSIDSETGYVYDQDIYLTVSYDGYNGDQYPYFVQYDGINDFRPISCYIDANMLLQCGLPSPVGPYSPTGVTYGQWYCDSSLIQANGGCVLEGGYSDDQIPDYYSANNLNGADKLNLMVIPSS